MKNCFDEQSKERSPVRWLRFQQMAKYWMKGKEYTVMNHEMFCFQCEQTAGCSGCMGKSGVCGKTAEIAALQDELTGALIGLVRAAEREAECPAEVDHLILDGLFTAITKM